MGRRAKGDTPVDVEVVATVHLPPRAAAIVGSPELLIRGFEGDASVFGTVRATGQYEPHVMDVIANRLPAGGVFVDVGANIGILAALAARRMGPRGTVVAIEASPINCELLAANLRETGSQRFTVLNRGVWDEPATLTISHIPQGPGWSFVSPEPSGQGIPFTVECETLDALLAEAGVGPVDLLKVDVEGAEVRVLRGARNLLQGNRPGIILEINPDTLQRVSGAGPRELYQCVLEYGYEMKVIAREGPLVPVTAYADLESWFQQGYAWVDVFCEPVRGAVG